MFDPYFVGEVDTKDVRVIETLGTRQFQMLKVVLKLEDQYYVLLLKPNIGRERDQIVLDRLKHVFNLRPMHTFGLRLNFVYVNGIRFDANSSEYFAFASAIERKQSDCIEDVNNLNLEQKIEALMILMFRYIVGATGNQNEHILIQDGHLLSISEGRFTTMEMCPDFASQFNQIPASVWVKARKRLLKGVLLDNIRGIVLQIDHPTNNIDKKSPKGPLSMAVRRIMFSIENRLDLVKNLELKELKEYLRVI